MDRIPSLSSNNVRFPNDTVEASSAGAAANVLPAHLLGVANVSLPGLRAAGSHAAVGDPSSAGRVDYGHAATALRPPRPLATTPSALQSLIEENHALEPGQVDRRTLRHQGRSLLATFAAALAADVIHVPDDAMGGLQALMDRIADEAVWVRAPAAVLRRQVEVLREQCVDSAWLSLRIAEQALPDGDIEAFGASIVFHADPTHDAPAHEVRLFRLELDIVPIDQVEAAIAADPMPGPFAQLAAAILADAQSVSQLAEAARVSANPR